MSLQATNNYPGHRARYSLPPSVILAGIRALELQGVDLPTLERTWGYSLAALRRPQLRLPAFLARRFWESASALSGDPALGLAAARHIDPGQLLGLGYLMQLMPSRLEALQTMTRHWPLVAAHMALNLQVQGQEVFLGLSCEHGLRPAQAEIDYWLYRQLQHLHSWEGAPPALLEARLRRPRPADERPWKKLCGDRIRFGMAHDELLLDLSALRHERAAGSPGIRQALEEALHEYARQTAAPSPLEAVSAAVLRAPQAANDFEALAGRLNMTSRTLHRALQREGWSFSEIVECHRRYLAHDLLCDGRLNIAEVADRLGYAEVRSFARAFRRWYGIPPSELRERSTHPAP